MKKLKITDFQQFYQDNYYGHIFKHEDNWYEITLETCLNGFCIGAYLANDKKRELLYPKLCTREDGYSHDLLGIAARHPKTYHKAVLLANRLYGYILENKTSEIA